MSSYSVNWTGVDEFLRKANLIPERLGRNAGRRALRKGANVIRDAAQANARRIDDPNTREQIAKNIAVSGGGKRREQAVGGVMMRVGVRGGAKPTSGDNGTPGGNTTHWRFVELGTSHARAQPFMLPAMTSKAQAAFNAIVADLNPQIDKELAKLK